MAIIVGFLLETPGKEHSICSVGATTFPRRQKNADEDQAMLKLRAVPIKETSSFYNIGYRIKKYCFPTHGFYNIIHTKSKLNVASKTDRSIVTTIFTAHVCSVDITQ